MMLDPELRDRLTRVETTLRERRRVTDEKFGEINKKLDAVEAGVAHGNRTIDRWSAALEAHLLKNGTAIEHLADVTARNRTATNGAWAGIGLALATAVGAIAKAAGWW